MLGNYIPLMRKLIWIISALLIGIFLICIGGVVFTSYLPKLIQSWLLPDIRKQVALSGLSLSIRKLDLFGIDVSDIRINDDLEQGIEIDSVKVDFSPKTLVQKQIKSLSVNGINLYCIYKNGQLSIPGLFSVSAEEFRSIGRRIPNGCGQRRCK